LAHCWFESQRTLNNTWKTTSITRRKVNYKCKAKEKSRKKEKALPLTICLVNEVRIFEILRLILGLKSSSSILVMLNFICPRNLKAAKKNDATFLVDEFCKDNIEEVWDILNEEVKMAKKILEDKTRFKKYTKLQDFEKLYLLLVYYIGTNKKNDWIFTIFREVAMDLYFYN
jgi:hypothetical protein